jgi:SAM-dependent methyltransferase
MSSEALFSEYARYYDLLYRDKDYGAEANYVNRLIQQWSPGAKTVLELGAGTGKHASLLADLGYVVHGIERSEEMLADAVRRVEVKKKLDPSWVSASFSLGDIRSARVSRSFQSVISLFHVMSYQVTNDDLLAAFKTAREHLATGGAFIFDVWYGPTVLTDRPVVRVKRMADAQIDVTRLAEPVMRPNENVVEVNYHVFIRNKSSGVVSETKEKHLMRYLFKPEIEAFAVASGFVLQHCEEWMSAKTLGFDTWGACFVLRAV